MTPEFSRPIKLDTIGSSPRAVAIAADAAECAALAQRFGLVAIERIDAEARIHRTGELIFAEGRLRARVTQSCVATGEPLPFALDEPFALRFAPAAALGEAEELELGADDCDLIGYAGGAIDLGEATAETLALALDPFPRGPGADAALKAAGVLGEGEAGPFAALKALRNGPA